MTRHSPIQRKPSLPALAAAALVLALAGRSAFAADASTETSNARYLKDRADCEAGHTAEDKATCLKEAGAAQEERKKHTLDNSGTPVINATDRCNVLPARDKADCLARVLGPIKSNQVVTTTGSVAGGGVIKETTTTTPGAIIVITPAPMPAPASPPASAP